MRMQLWLFAIVLATQAGTVAAQMSNMPGMGSSSPNVKSMSDSDLMKQYCELQNPAASSSSGSSMMGSMGSKAGMTDAAKQAATDKMKSEIADELKRRSITLPGCGK